MLEINLYELYNKYLEKAPCLKIKLNPTEETTTSKLHMVCVYNIESHGHSGRASF